MNTTIFDEVLATVLAGLRDSVEGIAGIVELSCRWPRPVRSVL